MLKFNENDVRPLPALEYQAAKAAMIRADRPGGTAPKAAPTPTAQPAPPAPAPSDARLMTPEQFDGAKRAAGWRPQSRMPAGK